MCMCVFVWSVAEGFLAWAYVCMHVCAKCVFFIPPPGRPHAPSVSDWFSIHCHRETGKRQSQRKRRRWGGGREEERERQRERNDEMQTGEQAKNTARWLRERRGEHIYEQNNRKCKGVFMPTGHNFHSRFRRLNRWVHSLYNSFSSAAILHPNVRCHLRFQNDFLPSCLQPFCKSRCCRLSILFWKMFSSSPNGGPRCGKKRAEQLKR